VSYLDVRYGEFTNVAPLLGMTNLPALILWIRPYLIWMLWLSSTAFAIGTTYSPQVTTSPPTALTQLEDLSLMFRRADLTPLGTLTKPPPFIWASTLTPILGGLSPLKNLSLVVIMKRRCGT